MIRKSFLINEFTESSDKKKNNSKHILIKGFNLVELAIVLVIIGISLATVIKGKSLIQKAKFKSDIVKIRNWEQAFVQLKYDKELTLADYKEVSSKYFQGAKSIYGKYLSPSDFKLSSQPIYMYSNLILLNVGATEGIFTWSGEPEEKSSIPVNALIFNDMPISDPGSTPYVNSISKRMVCMFEEAIDDESLSGGRGMAGGHNAVMNMKQYDTKDQYENCDDFLRDITVFPGYSCRTGKCISDSENNIWWAWLLENDHD